MTNARAVRVALPADFDFAWATRFLAARAVSSLESVSETEYRRSVRVDDVPLTIVLRLSPGGHSGPALLARASPTMAPSALRALVVRLFDLDAELSTFERMARRDTVLSAIVRPRSGIRLPQLLDPLEGIVRAVLGQQVSVTGATTMTDRLVRLLGATAPSLEGSAFLAFPRAVDLVRAGATRLQSIGLTRARAATLIAVAEASLDGTLDWSRLRTAPADEAERALVSVRGIGPWTASYVRMRALGDRDAFPSADLGVIKALARVGIARGDVDAAAEAWRPWRGYATLHLWQSLSSSARAASTAR